MNVQNRTHSGFTLIELLTVIAIIAVLAAILFPVFATIRKKAGLTSCLENMHTVGQTVRLYYEDNNKYPASLYGFVEIYNQGTSSNNYYNGSGQPVAMSQVQLYRPLTQGQKYLRDTGVFQCPHNTNINPTGITGAYYPLAAGPALANQPAQFTAVMQHNMGATANGNPVLPAAMVGQPAYYYLSDSYDTGPRVNTDGTPVSPAVQELHYSLDWTGASGPNDAPNQLKYKSPPDNTTVITWCTYHDATAQMNQVNVLMLSGGTKAVSTNQFVGKGPLGFQE